MASQSSCSITGLFHQKLDCCSAQPRNILRELALLKFGQSALKGTLRSRCNGLGILGLGRLSWIHYHYIRSITNVIQAMLVL